MIGRSLLDRIRRDVDRHALRARHGIKHLTGGSFVQVGQTPSDTIWSHRHVQLRRYRRQTPPTVAQPLLLVPSLINRSYIFDLHPGNSTVETLLAAGFDVFLVDWGIPGPAEAANALETYVDKYLPATVAATVAEAGTETLTMVGYCMGGVLALLYAAGHSPSRVRSLVSLATPVDYGEMGLLVAVVREGRLEIDDVLDEDGNVPGDVIRRIVQLRRPTGALVTYANLLENLWSRDYMAGHQAISRWVQESVPVPGAFARQVVERLIRQNELATGRMTVGDRVVDLGSLKAPCLVVIAEQDDMVPISSAAPLTSLLRGSDDVQELRIPGGHIALTVGRRAHKHTFPHVIDWVRARSDPVVVKA